MMSENKKKKKKSPRYPLSKEEYLKAFVSELHEIVPSSPYDYKIIKKISKDVLNEKITPEQVIEIFESKIDEGITLEQVMDILKKKRKEK